MIPKFDGVCCCGVYISCNFFDSDRIEEYSLSFILFEKATQILDRIRTGHFNRIDGGGSVVWEYAILAYLVVLRNAGACVIALLLRNAAGVFHHPSFPSSSSSSPPSFPAHTFFF
jgi:hypothetical protein